MSERASRPSSASVPDSLDAYCLNAFGNASCRRRFRKRAECELGEIDAGGREAELALFKMLRAVEWYIEQHRDAPSQPGGIGKEFALLRARLVDALVKQNTGLVYAMIQRRQINDVDRDDLISNGLWALLQSVSGFDPWRGFRFSTYACTAIANSFRLLARKHQLNHSHLARLKTVQSRLPRTDANEADLDREIMAEQLHRTFHANHAELSGVERYVIRRRLLGTDRRAATLEAVGNSLALSKERVRQIQLVGLEKLRLFVARSAGA